MVDIEASSVSFLENRLAYVDQVKTFFSQRDTQPIWDGSIYVYKNNDKKKDNLLKAIPVQIKGDTTQSIKKNTIYYSADVADLKGFLTSDGVIYFVVGIDIEKEVEKIYYASLLPFDIKKILDDIKETQKNKNIKLHALPREKDEILDIFLNFIEDSKRQCNVKTMGLLSMQDLIDKGQVDHVECVYYTANKNMKNPIRKILGKKFYMYAVNSVGVTYPIKSKIFDELKQNFPQKISCEGVVYYNEVIIKQNKTSVIIQLGKSLNISYVKAKKENKITIELRSNGTVRERLRDVSFFLNMVERKEIYADDKLIMVVPESFQSQINIEEIKEHKSYLELLVQAMEKAGIPDNLLDYANIEGENGYRANSLIEAFVNDNAVGLDAIEKKLPQNISAMGILEVCKDVKVIIWAECIGPNQYKIKNFFNNDVLNLANVTINDKKISRYVLLKKSHFLNVANINYEAIYSDILSYPINNEYIDNLLILMLNMLKAYDESKNNKTLETAEQIAQLILDKSNPNQKDIHKINFLQCIKRQRLLSDDEKDRLYNIIFKNQDKAIKAGCYILLDMFQKAQDIITLMSEEQRVDFMKFPIYNLLDKKSLEKLAKSS